MFDHYDFKISDHFLSLLINGDSTGLSDEDESLFNDWYESTDRRIQHWDAVDHLGFGRCEVTNSMSDCSLVRGYFRTDGGA